MGFLLGIVVGVVLGKYHKELIAGIPVVKDYLKGLFSKK